jgi:hypothetical protein
MEWKISLILSIGFILHTPATGDIERHVAAAM